MYAYSSFVHKWYESTGGCVRMHSKVTLSLSLTPTFSITVQSCARRVSDTYVQHYCTVLVCLWRSVLLSVQYWCKVCLWHLRSALLYSPGVSLTFGITVSTVLVQGLSLTLTFSITVQSWCLWRSVLLSVQYWCKVCLWHLRSALLYSLGAKHVAYGQLLSSWKT